MFGRRRFGYGRKFGGLSWKAKKAIAAKKKYRSKWKKPYYKKSYKKPYYKRRR
jgi:hypothetical protein